jgi:DNA (cytosine-5)-methyltransferase 1
MGDLGYGVCWRVLDAQFFGVAQRRRRIFVVGYLGDWRPAAAVLFEPESLRGDPTASREKGKEVTGTLGSRSAAGGGFSTDFECAGGLQPEQTVGALCARDYKGVGSQFVDEGKVFPEVAQTINSRDHKGVSCGRDGVVGNPVVQVCADVSPSLTSSGPPFSRTGNSRVEADAMVVTPINDKATRCQGGGPTRDNDGAGNGLGVGKEGDPSPTLTGGDRHAICIQGSMIGRKEENGPQGDGVNEEISFTQNATDRHAVAYRKSRRAQSVDDNETWVDDGKANTLNSFDGGDVRATHAVVQAPSLSVRRLTPVECERLQGFPDDYTKIPYRGKPAEKCPDGPRYKACGNSMAVPVMRWIGERIDIFMKATTESE